MTETVAVIGAGIGGLCTALTLAPTGRKIIVLERDASPPSDDPDTVFHEWRHTGVGQLRQSHAFLARLRSIIKTEHPGLLEDLLALGVRELPFEAMLSEMQRETYEPEPDDAELTIITSRRTTLELAIRRYVEKLENVTIQSGFLVRRLLTQKRTDGVIDVLGVIADSAGGEVTVKADVVVDASGKSGFIIDQVMEESANTSEEQESAGILYFTRHYRLKPGMDEPSRTDNPPATGDLGFVKFGVFPGDNGCFSITLAIPEVEMELRKAILNPDIFHAMTLEFPGLKPWTNADRSDPVGRVHGMGDLISRWRELVVDGRPATHGYFALGDTLIRTNPLYGRGCSFAAASAQVLRQTLDESPDPEARALAFHKRLHTELKPYYINQRTQDRSAIKRARQALTPDYRKSRRARLMESFFEDGVAIAVRYDIALMREAMRGFHMLEHPNKWLGKPRNLAKVFYYWTRGKKRNAMAYPPKPGPERREMMQALSLDFRADIDRIAQGA
jgi:2-polyprenyl-6-methoxyphenol hydroxylase-like FAD-dependent oxidoreductase